MKTLSLRYKKIDMCPNFCMLYYREYVNITECKTYRHIWYKPNTGRGRTLVTYKKKLNISQSLLSHKGIMSLEIPEYITWYKGWSDDLPF